MKGKEGGEKEEEKVGMREAGEGIRGEEGRERRRRGNNKKAEREEGRRKRNKSKEGTKGRRRRWTKIEFIAFVSRRVEIGLFLSHFFIFLFLSPFLSVVPSG